MVMANRSYQVRPEMNGGTGERMAVSTIRIIFRAVPTTLSSRYSHGMEEIVLFIRYS